MPRPDFPTMSARLLEGGIAPHNVRRLVREVSDHYDDLLRTAHSEADASLKIGSADDIVRDALARPELKSWGARWPWAVYGLGPVISMAAIPFLVFVLFFAVIGPLIASLPGFVRQVNPAEMLVFNTLCAFFTYGLVPLLAFSFGVSALRRRVSSPWVPVGIAVVSILSGVLEMHVNWPATPTGSPELWVGIFDETIAYIRMTQHAAMNLALASPILFFLQRARASRRRSCA